MPFLSIAGNSYSPASSPFFGRLRKTTCLLVRITRIVLSSIVLAFFGCLLRILLPGAMQSYKAEFLPRTVAALRCTVWQTDGCAKLHQRLIKVTGAILWHDRTQFILYSFFYRLIGNIAVILKSRAMTRSTFPSTAGLGCLKAIEETAPAV